MRRSESICVGLVGLSSWIVAVAWATQACVVPLDNEFPVDASPDVECMEASQEGSAPLTVAGCPAFQTVVPALDLAGNLRSIAQSDGGSLWVADQATWLDGGTGPAVIALGPGAGADCSGWQARLVGPAFAPSPLSPSGLLTPLDLVATPSGLALFYELFVSDATQPLGLRELGVGLAVRDASSGLFVPTGGLLWTADRPTYGTSVLVVDATAYVFGCSSTGAFSAQCFVARSDTANLGSTAGYSYWAGGDWSSDVDDATPIADGSGAISVRRDPTGESRYIMTFVPPLGSTLVAQSAPAPEGPWSGPVTLAACDVTGAGSGAFCAGGQQHPELGTGAGPLVLTYDAQTFGDSGAPSGAYGPHLVALSIPKALP